MKKTKLQKRSFIIVGIILAVAIIGLFMIDSRPVTAQQALNSNTIAKTSPTAESKIEENIIGNAMPSMIRMICALIVVICCIYGGIFLLKRSMGKKYAGGGNSILEVLETTSVAPKKTISLVKVMDKSVLIGVTENGISMLTELDSEQTKKVLAYQCSAEERIDFKKSFKTAWGKVLKISPIKKEAALNS